MRKSFITDVGEGLRWLNEDYTRGVLAVKVTVTSRWRRSLRLNFEDASQPSSTRLRESAGWLSSKTFRVRRSIVVWFFCLILPCA